MSSDLRTCSLYSSLTCIRIFVSGSPNREHSLSSSVDMSHLQSEVAAALRGHSNKQDNESVFEASGSFNRQRLEASISEDGFPLMRDGRTLSVQSFETNHEPLFNEFQNANQGGVYTSSQDILSTACLIVKLIRAGRRNMRVSISRLSTAIAAIA